MFAWLLAALPLVLLLPLAPIAPEHLYYVEFLDIRRWTQTDAFVFSFIATAYALAARAYLRSEHVLSAENEVAS